MLHCYINCGRDYVASINKQSPAADAYAASLPWLLLLSDGRVRRFPSMAEARDEAQKRFAPVVFRRS